MESVYFGKENSDLHKITTEPKPQENAPKGPREYYFPNENNKKLDIIAFISALLASALLDALIFGLVYPAIILTLRNSYPVFKLIRVNEFILADIFILYALLFFIIYFIIHNIGRKKVYVNDNGTFYFLKMKVKVKTQRSDSSIHAKYSRYINRINRQIARNGFRIYKVLTGCKESDNIHDDGIFFSGYNEKTLNDEEFKIPAGYIKYDKNANYHKNKIGYTILFWMIKLAFYGSVMLWLISIGQSRLNTFNECFDSYRDERIAMLEPVGFKYLEGNAYWDHTYEYLEFDDTSDNKNNYFRVYFDITEDGKITDESLSFFYDLNYSDDTESIKNAIRALYDGDLPELDAIDETIREYKLKRTEQRYHVATETIYFTVYVYESNYGDYRIYINFSEMNKPIYLF